MPEPEATLEAVWPVVLALGLCAASLLAFALRYARQGRPRTPAVEARAAPELWKWLMAWWIWMCGPVERACLALGLTATSITVTGAALTAVAGAVFASGHLSIGGWIYLLASSLDLLDGRVARAQGTASAAGAFLDSTLDRASELLAFGGLALCFRASPILYAALLAGGASMLVSYARARAEALGVVDEARVGGMQRAERVVLTGVPCALSPLSDALFGPAHGPLVTGTCLAFLAVITSFTAVRRVSAVWNALRVKQRGSPVHPVRYLEPRRQERLGR